MRGPKGSLRHAVGAAGCLGLLALAGCGNTSRYANNPRPASPIVITAAILPGKVSVSPSHFGAGPVSLVVTNQTGVSQQIRLVREVNGSEQAAGAQTGPINPNDTASLKADVDQGEYVVRVENDGIKPARISVGSKRPSAQNELLQP